MQVAQLPASQENGGLSPARRADSSTVSPSTYSMVRRLPLKMMVKLMGFIVSSAKVRTILCTFASVLSWQGGRRPHLCNGKEVA